MAHASSLPAPRAAFAPASPVQASDHSWRHLLRRMFEAMVKARQRQVDREITRYLESIGGSLTDHAEREIERRYLREQRW
jgi:hypothetical protein